MYSRKIVQTFISVVCLLFSMPGTARLVTTDPIICSNNVEQLQQNASTAYLVELSDVQYGDKPDGFPLMGINGILYSPARLTILKIYRDTKAELTGLDHAPQQAVLARVCDSLYNERNGDCWALQMSFEDGQRWVMFDTSRTNNTIYFTLRDCPAASFLVENDTQLKAWEDQYLPVSVEQQN